MKQDSPRPRSGLGSPKSAQKHGKTPEPQKPETGNLGDSPGTEGPAEGSGWAIWESLEVSWPGTGS